MVRNAYLRKFAPTNQNALAEFDVRYTTTKFVVDRAGAVVYNAIGDSSERQWERVFQQPDAWAKPPGFRFTSP